MRPNSPQSQERLCKGQRQTPKRRRKVLSPGRDRYFPNDEVRKHARIRRFRHGARDFGY